MRVTIGAFSGTHIDGSAGKIIVVVIAILRRYFFKKKVHIFHQKRFVLVNFDGRGRMLGINIDHPFVNACIFDKRFDLFGNIYKLRSLARFEF